MLTVSGALLYKSPAPPCAHVNRVWHCAGEARCSTSGCGSLGEQAALLHHHADQLLALKRLTGAMQVTLARMVVMRVLSLLSVR